MPYSISNLIEGNPKPTCVSRSAPIQEALAVMIEHDYSQIPIVDDDDRPMGMVTDQSILRSLNNFGLTVSELNVADAMVKAYLFRPEDDLFDVLHRLQDTYAVLIVDGDGRLTGIVTDYDTNAYFQRRAEDMMLIEDIETMIRELTLSVFTDDSGSVDEKELRSAIKAAKIATKKFERFSLYDYTKLFLHERQWAAYGSYFSLSPEAIRRLFDGVRDTRNRLAHFRGDITPQSRSQLRFCNEWLARYHDLIIGASADVVPPDEENMERDVVAGGVAPTAEEIAPTDSRYAPLALWLQSQPIETKRLNLSFDKVEEIIGGTLPDSAYSHRSWWANDAMSHVQSQQWLDVGWRVATVNMTERIVRFARIVERERAYIDFYNDLMTELDKEPIFDNLWRAHDGSSWHWVESISIDGHYLAAFHYSFGRGRTFRAELYIDTGNKETNKRMFDELQARQEAIEQAVGTELSWQRLNNRRASRIAIVHGGSITDSQKALASLRDKAVESMVALKNGISQPVLEIAAKVIGAE